MLFPDSTRLQLHVKRDQTAHHQKGRPKHRQRQDNLFQQQHRKVQVPVGTAVEKDPMEDDLFINVLVEAAKTGKLHFDINHQRVLSHGVQDLR